jgi:hypothetical protein
LDPRPAPGSPALTSDVAPVPEIAFFVQTDYIGAFGNPGNVGDRFNRLWIADWTALSELGVLDPQNAVTDVEPTGETPTQVALSQNYPNPFNPTTTIEFALDRAQDVRLAVYDLLGREVAVLVDGQQPAGTFRATFDATELASGLYLYRLQTATGTVTRTMTLLK